MHNILRLLGCLLGYVYYLTDTQIIFLLLRRLVFVHICYWIVSFYVSVPLYSIAYTFGFLLVYDVWYRTQEFVINQKKHDKYVAQQKSEDVFRPLSELASRASRNRDTIPGGGLSVITTEPYCVECDPEQLIVLPDTRFRNENDDLICYVCHYQTERCYFCKVKYYREEMTILPNDVGYVCHNCAEGLRLFVTSPKHQCRECEKDFYRDELKFIGVPKVPKIGEDVDWGLICKDCGK